MRLTVKASDSARSPFDEALFETSWSCWSWTEWPLAFSCARPDNRFSTRARNREQYASGVSFWVRLAWAHDVCKRSRWLYIMFLALLSTKGCKRSKNSATRNMKRLVTSNVLDRRCCSMIWTAADTKFSTLDRHIASVGPSVDPELIRYALEVT